jgi:hypothetical protein
VVLLHDGCVLRAAHRLIRSGSCTRCHCVILS